MFKILAIPIIIAIALYLWPVELGGSTVILAVTGKSMYPTIPSGSIVIGKVMDDYNIDDIIIYDTRDNKTIVHRIIDKDNGIFTAKGDNNERPDSYRIEYKDIRGKVVFFIPFIGNIILLLKNPMILLFASLFTLLLLARGKDREIKEGSIIMPAILINIISYIIMLIAIINGNDLKLDTFTNMLSNIFERYIAVSISFALVHIMLMILYFYRDDKLKTAEFAIVIIIVIIMIMQMLAVIDNIRGILS